ncbi:MAG: ATP-binding protein [Planctomycetota bacterium]|nr:ATP-binding protein [Planctomycetota bacterium]
MISGSFLIKGGDFENVGSASWNLKEILKRVGVEATDLRRALIVAYEAETNVVIHAYRGIMRYKLDSDQLYIEVEDEGPGIPDIELAMKEGFSTASEKARELGFGAGMGLPNIKKNSNRFLLESVDGKGTRVAATINLKKPTRVVTARNSIKVERNLCRLCLRCLYSCPMAALRLRFGSPILLDHLCIDCTSCIASCEYGTLTVASKEYKHQEGALLVIHPSFLFQFGEEVSAEDVISVLKTVGFSDVQITDAWEEALRKEVSRYATEKPEIKPVISPLCPSITNLIQTRFPSLIENIPPFLSPLEASQRELNGHLILFAVSCPSQQTLFSSRALQKVETVPVNVLRKMILPHIMELKKRKKLSRTPPTSEPKIRKMNGESPLRVFGIHHALDVLEKVENGLLTDVSVVELFACCNGCFGSPLLSEDPHVAYYRWMRSHYTSSKTANPVPREEPLIPRTGLRLGENIAESIRKLEEMDRLIKSLPGRNCGVCGAPTCNAFAEDILFGRADKSLCIYTSEKRNCNQENKI